MANVDSVEVLSPLWIRLLPAFLRARLLGRSNLQAMLGNSSWLFLDKILRMGVGLIVGLWVARYLGPNRFGQWNFAVALAYVFNPIANLGLDRIVVRELVKFPERRNELLGTAFILRLLAALATLAVLLVVTAALRPDDRLTLCLVALSGAGFIFQSTTVIDLFFQSRLQSRQSVLATNIAFVLISLAKVVLVLIAAPLVAFAIAGFAEVFLAAILLGTFYHLNNQEILEWRIDLKTARDLLRLSWPLMLTGISIVISMRVDQVLIGQFMSDKQVGFYSAAAKIAEIWYFVPIGIASSTFPLLVEIRKKSEELYYRRLQQLFNGMVLVSVAFAAAMTFLSGPIVSLLYGPAYVPAVGALKILIWSGVPVAYGCIWSNWMVLENRTKTMFFYQTAAAIINLTLNVVLIPKFGILGSSYATLISYWFGHTVLAAIMKSQHRALVMLIKSLVPYWIVSRTRNELYTLAGEPCPMLSDSKTLPIEMLEEPMNIVFASDTNYAEPLAVAMCSLFENNPGRCFTVYVINADLTGETWNRLETIARQYGQGLIDCKIRDDDFSDLVTTLHFTKANYYRLLIPDRLPMSRALYLDADIVVRGSIDDLYNTNVDDWYLAAVVDPTPVDTRNLEMSADARYFNSGVMMLNLDRLRRDQIKDAVINFVRRKPSAIRFVDQCGLNAIVNGRWKAVHPKFNLQGKLFDQSTDDYCKLFPPGELAAALKDPTLVHYSGKAKPWHIRYSLPYRRAYWKYLRKTPFSHLFSNDITVRRFVRWSIPRTLRSGISRARNTDEDRD